MRTIGQFSKPEGLITLFHWNQKYLIKIERGPFEQTFKLSELDVEGPEALKALVTDEFLRAAGEGFQRMEQALTQALELIGPSPPSLQRP